jgi:biotin transporter BioY
MADSVSPYVIVGLGLIIGVSCFTTFILISRFVGSKDNWSRIKDEYTASIWLLSIGGSIALFVAGIAYFSVEPNQEKIMYFIFVVTFLAMGLSSSALAVALIHKK